MILNGYMGNGASVVIYVEHLTIHNWKVSGFFMDRKIHARLSTLCINCEIRLSQAKFVHCKRLVTNAFNVKEIIIFKIWCIWYIDKNKFPGKERNERKIYSC